MVSRKGVPIVRVNTLIDAVPEYLSGCARLSHYSSGSLVFVGPGWQHSRD